MGPSPASSICLDGWWGEAIFKALCVYLYRPRLLCSPRGFLLEGIYLTRCVLPLWGNKEEKNIKARLFCRPPFTQRSLFLSPISSLHLWHRKTSLNSVTKRSTSPYPKIWGSWVHSPKSEAMCYCSPSVQEGTALSLCRKTPHIFAELILRYLGTSPCSRICLSEVWPDHYPKSLVMEVRLQKMAVTRKKIRAWRTVRGSKEKRRCSFLNVL